MSFWDLVYNLWFVFLALAVFSVIGAAVWESKAAKRRKATMLAEQQAGKAEESPAAEPADAKEADATESPDEATPEEPADFDPLK